MTDARDIQRILVALDSSVHSRAALEAATKLATYLKAELLGLFVEDINLLRLAELPCAGEVVYASSTTRTLDTSRLERALRLQAAELERTLAGAAQATNVHWTFRVARGQVINEVLAAAREADMLVLGSLGRSLGRRVPLGSTAQAVANTATRTVVFLQHGVRLGQPVLVLFDGTDIACRALETAVRFAREDGTNLIVLIPTDNPEVSSRLKKEVTDWLRGQGHKGRIQCFAGGEGVAGLTSAVELEKAGTLVLPADYLPVQDKALSDLMSQIKCPVVLVR